MPIESDIYTNESGISVMEIIFVCSQFCLVWASIGNKRAANSDEQKIQDLTTQLEVFNGKSLALWLGKFVQKVVNKNGGKYPARTLYSIISGIKYYLEEKNAYHALNLLDKSDKQYNCILLCINIIPDCTSD